MDRWMSGGDGWKDRWKDGLVVGWFESYLDGSLDLWIEEWMYG